MRILYVIVGELEVGKKVALLVASLSAISLLFSAAVCGSPKLLAAAGLTTDIGAIIQLKISGVLDKAMGTFGDERVHPYGPPSYITREIVDDPDHRFSLHNLRNGFFYNDDVGYYGLVIGFALQLLGVLSA